MRVTCKEFKDDYAHLNIKQHNIQFNWPQLRHAVVTMGFPSLRAALPSTQHALAFALHKIFALECIIKIDDRGTLKLHDKYENLDQSEKGVLSYWLGMCIAKIVAYEILDVSWPVHFRHFMKENPIEMNIKKSPDYVGSDSKGNWHVIEAKGFHPEPGLINRGRWKEQVGSIDSILGKPPETRSYCLTRVKKKITIELVDPPGNKGKTKFDLSITPEQTQKFYYQPYLDLFSAELNQPDNIDNNRMLYKSIGFDSLNKTKYSIAIERSILESILRNELVKKTEPILQDYWYLGSDGIALKKEPSTKEDCIEYHRH